MGSIVGAAFGALEAGLKLWQSLESRKYLDKLMLLKTRYYEEKRKPDPNMAILDDIEHQLIVLCNAFSSAAPSGSAPTPASG